MAEAGPLEATDWVHVSLSGPFTHIKRKWFSTFDFEDPVLENGRVVLDAQGRPLQTVATERNVYVYRGQKGRQRTAEEAEQQLEELLEQTDASQRQRQTREAQQRAAAAAAKAAHAATAAARAADEAAAAQAAAAAAQAAEAGGRVKPRAGSIARFPRSTPAHSGPQSSGHTHRRSQAKPPKGPKYHAAAVPAGNRQQHRQPTARGTTDQHRQQRAFAAAAVASKSSRAAAGAGPGPGSARSSSLVKIDSLGLGMGPDIPYTQTHSIHTSTARISPFASAAQQPFYQRAGSFAFDQLPPVSTERPFDSSQQRPAANHDVRTGTTGGSASSTPHLLRAACFADISTSSQHNTMDTNPDCASLQHRSTILHASSAQQPDIPPEGILLKLTNPPREILVSPTLLGNGRNGSVYASKMPAGKVLPGWAVATKIFHSSCPSDRVETELEVKRLVAESGLASLKVLMRQLYAGTVELQGETYRCHVYERLGESLQQVMQASGKPFTELTVKHVAHQLLETMKQHGLPLGGDSSYSLQHSSLHAGNILLAKDSRIAGTQSSSSSNMRYCPIKICGLSNCRIRQQAAVAPLTDTTAAAASAANSSTGYSAPAAVSHSGEIKAVGKLVVDLLTGGCFSLQQAGSSSRPAQTESQAPGWQQKDQQQQEEETASTALEVYLSGDSAGIGRLPKAWATSPMQRALSFVQACFEEGVTVAQLMQHSWLARFAGAPAAASGLERAASFTAAGDGDASGSTAARGARPAEGSPSSQQVKRRRLAATGGGISGSNGGGIGGTAAAAADSHEPDSWEDMP